MGIDFYFVKLLYDTALEQGSPNIIIQARDSALEKILSGNDSVLTSVTINGKTIVKNSGLTPVDLANAANLALDYYKNGPQASFSIDYTSTGMGV